MSFVRRDIRGGAVQTTTSGSLTSGSTSCTIAATTGWPDGSAGAFYVVIDPGLSGEEKILCSTRSSTTLNFSTRGADGTTAASHASGAVIYPCVTAVDIDEANYWVAELHGAASANGKVLVGDGTDSIAGVAASTAGKLLQSNGTTWVANTVSGDVTINGSGITAIGAGKVTSAMLSTTDTPYLTGAGAPTNPPATAGFMYMDTTNNRLYVANSTPKWVCITPVSQFVATAEGVTADNTYRSFATNSTVTVITGTKALVRYTMLVAEGATSTTEAWDCSVAVSSATTLAAGTLAVLRSNGNGVQSRTQTWTAEELYTSLTAGSNVFTLQHKTFRTGQTCALRGLTIVGIP